MATDPTPGSALSELVTELRAFTKLWRSQARQERFNRTVSPALDSAEGWVVWHLDETSPLRARDLVQATGIGKPGVSKAVRRLTDSGLVDVVRDAEDRRVSWIRLTSEGQQVADSLREAATEMIRGSVESWTEDEQRALAALLRRLTGEHRL